MCIRDSAHDLHLGVEQAQGFDRRGVVRLHVIDHQVIDRPVFQDRADICLLYTSQTAWGTSYLEEVQNDSDKSEEIF